MQIDFDHFKNNLPSHVLELLELCERESFLPSLIGGIPRDYLIHHSIGSDFDICLRPLKNMSQIEKLKELLQKEYDQYAEKSFGVIDLGEGLEVSFPRIEHFKEGVGHSNFEVELIQDLDFKIDCQRRDFSLNAISFTYTAGEFKINDPLDGLSDIRNRIIKACSYQNFVKDPVRFLRAIRFHILLDFEFETNTEEILKNMQLSFTPHYLRYEASKTKRPLTFLLMMKYFQSNSVPFDFDETDDDILEYENEIELSHLGDHVRYAFFLDRELRLNILSFFGLKTSHVFVLDHKNIDLYELTKYEAESLEKLSYIKELIKFFELAASIDKNILNSIQFKKPIHIKIFEEYQQCKVKVPSEIEPRLRSIFIFKEKLKELL